MKRSLLMHTTRLAQIIFFSHFFLCVFKNKNEHLDIEDFHSLTIQIQFEMVTNKYWAAALVQQRIYLFFSFRKINNKNNLINARSVSLLKIEN